MTLLLLGLLLLAPPPGSPELIGPQKPPDPVGTMELVERDTLPALPGMGNFLHLVAIENLPASAAERNAFLSGFRGAFTDDALRTERVPRKKPGPPRPSLPIRNRFHLLEGSESRGTWQAQVTLEWLPPVPVAAVPRDTSQHVAATPPGLRVTYWALTPEAVEADARPLPIREELSFESAGASPAGFAEHAGRQVALMLLETLHQLAGELDDDQRVRLEATARRSLTPR